VSAAQLLNGVALGSLLMILSSGLALIYGLRGVTNFAHGALYMGGAYVAYTVTSTIGFWWSLIIVPLVLAGLGAILEFAVFRPLQSRSHIEVGLITFGISLILSRVIVIIWGSQTLAVSAPQGLDGTMEIGPISFPSYRIFLIVCAIVIAVALVVWLRGTRTGLRIRAASQDIRIAAITGVNVDRASLLVVCIGTGLAGLAGTLAAPYVSVDPGMGASILITTLIIVVIGGAGNIGTTMLVGMGLGIVQTMVTLWSPPIAVLIPYVALVVVLVRRPEGLGARRTA
jgi:branched-chain amino acid transport system permease protein